MASSRSVDCMMKRFGRLLVRPPFADSSESEPPEADAEFASPEAPFPSF